MRQDSFNRSLKWTDKELEYLKINFPGNPTWQIANELNRPLNMVKKKAFELDLKKSKRRKQL